MACTLHVAWDDQLAGYDFGPGHPLAPVRVELTIELARALRRARRRPGCRSSARTRPPTRSSRRCTTRRYIAAVRQAGGPEPGRRRWRFGLGTAGQPGVPRHARRVGAGGRRHPGRRPGGVDRRGASTAPASPAACTTRCAASASGFCVYNDPAIAIAWLLDAGRRAGRLRRHRRAPRRRRAGRLLRRPAGADDQPAREPGDAVPRHRLPSETGGPGAEGSAVNVALPAGTGDAGWLRAFHAVVPPLLRAFRPQILVSQHGCDTHWLDPLADLRLTIDAQRAAHAAIHQLAHEVGRRPLAADRRRRLRAGPGRAADLDAPAGRGSRVPDRPPARIPACLARLRVPPHRPARHRS